MINNINARFDELLEKGKSLVSRMYTDREVGELKFNWVPTDCISEYQSWMLSAVNLIRTIVSEDNAYFQQCNSLMSHESFKTGISSKIFLRIFGLFSSAKDEWDKGLLKKFEYIIVGATFDNFLDHATQYHKGNMKTEAGVLASAVLEDTMKKIAQKNNVPAESLTLDPLIDKLAAAGVFKKEYAKRLKSYAGFRNCALHANWEQLDIRDIGDLISGIRDLIERYL